MTKKEQFKLFKIIASAVLLATAYTLCTLLSLPVWAKILIYLVPYAVSGYDVVLRCFKDIANGEVFSENFLMTIATVGAFAICEYPEAVFVMIFYGVGSLFESIAVGKSRNSISHLTEMIPENAEVLRNGETVSIPIDEIAVGDTLIVKAGERFPVDGSVISGSANIDTSALTGESLPLNVTAGDSVLSGSIALDGAIHLRVEKPADESAVAKIVEMIENASSTKAKTEKFITSFSRIYTPAVVIAAALIAIVPSLIFGNFAQWLHRALIFLVVSCPCALVISVPLSYFGGIGAAAKAGVLTKGSDSLEALAKVKNFVFDKTGTLTKADFNVSSVTAKGISEEELILLAAGVESASSHPLAKALVAYCKSNVNKQIPVPESVKETPGMGIEAVVSGRNIAVGSEKLMKKLGITTDNIPSGACICVVADGKYVGSVSFSDTVKPNSEKAVSELKSKGCNVFMLSGDRKSAVEACASSLGIENFAYQMLPEDKAKEIEKIGRKNGKVAFTGDGINDAPCLAAADVGIAMGAFGSDLAIECADIVLTDDDPMKLVTAVNISKKVRRIVIENIVFALSVKAIVLILASLGAALMWEAVIADVGVSVIAIFNSLRLLKAK